VKRNCGLIMVTMKKSPGAKEYIKGTQEKEKI